MHDLTKLLAGDDTRTRMTSSSVCSSPGRASTRIICPALAELDPQLPNHIARNTALGRPWREFEHALDQQIADATITA